MPTATQQGAGNRGPTANLTKPPSSKEDVLSLVERTESYVKPFKEALERQWVENILFLTGEHWVRFNTLTNRFTRHQLEGWVPTPSTNYMVKHYDRAIDLFTSPDWTPRGKPASESQNDIDAAEHSSRMLRHLRRTLHSDLKYLDAASWFLLTGNVFFYANWDPQANVVVRRPEEILKQTPLILPRAVCQNCRDVFRASFNRQRCPTCQQGITQLEDTPMLGADGLVLQSSETVPVLDKDGKQKFKEFSLGEVDEAIPNVFNIFPQPRERWEDVMYIMEEVVFDLDELADTFGSDAVKDIAPENILSERLSGFGTSAGNKSDYFNTHSQLQNMVRVKYYRHIAGEKFPDGQYIIEANKKVLHHGDIDTVDGQLPYEHAKYRHISGEMWGVSPFSDVVPLQKRINSIDSSIILNRKTMLNPQWTIPQGSGVTKIDGRPGLLVRYNPHNTGGAKPEVKPGVGLPADIIQERAQAVTDMEEVFGTQEILGGQAPQGIEAGVALNIIAEQAFKRFGGAVKRWRKALARHEKRKLLIMKEFYEEERLIEVGGENTETELFHLSGADIGNTTDVIVEMEQGANFSKAAQDQRLLSAVQMGLLGDVRRPEIAGKILEKLDIEGFDSEFTLDAKKARRELVKLKNGEEVAPPNQFDNHQIHFVEETDFIKTSDFENLDPQIQQRIMEHTQQHLAAIQQAQAQAQQAALAAKGSSENATDNILGAQPGAQQSQQIQAQA
jgi:hypothetical protein